MRVERFERVYNVIRNRICLLEYEPGARLGEEELAREFGVSRTPIRRVLSRLNPRACWKAGMASEPLSQRSTSTASCRSMSFAWSWLSYRRLDPVPRSEEDLNRVRAILKKCDDMMTRALEFAGDCRDQCGILPRIGGDDRQPAAQGNFRAPFLPSRTGFG